MSFRRPGRNVTRFSVVVLALLAFGLSTPGCGRKKDADNPIVARIGDTVIRKWDFVSAVQRAPRDVWPSLDSLDHANRVEFVKTMVSKRLLEMEALRRFPALPADQEYLVRKHEREMVFAALSSELAPARRLSSEDTEECRKTLTPLYYAHTLVLDSEARAKEVAAGQWTDETFNDLVRKETLVMEVQETLSNDFMRSIRAPELVPEALPALENVTEGTILGPYKLQAGWVVYRISQIAVPPDSVQADTTGLADVCRKLRRSIAYNKAVTELLRKSPIAYNEENLSWLQKRYADTFAVAHAKYQREILIHKDALIPPLDEAERGRELARTAGAPYTAGQFIDEFAARPITDYPNILHRGSIRLLVEQILTDGVLWREAERKGIPKRAEIADSVTRKRDDVLLSYFVDTVLLKEAEARITEEKLQKFYNEHLDDFMTRGKLELELIYLDNYKLGTKLTTMLKRGEEFRKVVAAAKAGDPTAEAVPRTGRFDKEMEPELYDFAREFEVGGASGPIRMQNGRFVVYRVLYHGPPEPQKFELVRIEVTQTVAFQEREQLLDELLTQLRASNPVQIEESNL